MRYTTRKKDRIARSRRELFCVDYSRNASVEDYHYFVVVMMNVQGAARYLTGGDLGDHEITTTVIRRYKKTSWLPIFGFSAFS